MKPILELKNISKNFPGIKALDQVSFSIIPGEVHMLLGENGAGKSTLMNVVYGLLPADSGEILIDGKKVEINSPADALAVGIGMVHQHFMLVPVFTVAENIVLGHEQSKRGVLTLADARIKIKRIADEFKFEIDPDALIENLPVGVQQRVEIIRALMYDAKVLILDEPTAALGVKQSSVVLNYIAKARKAGLAVVFITHNPHHAYLIGDHFVILKLGKINLDARRADITSEQLIKEMAGGEELTLLAEQLDSGNV